jgi:triacylglycerol esterase/lipase EstA (alpha/beta hydrolase family)
VPTADLDAAFQCIAPPRAGDRGVLLVHGTSLTAEEHWGWNYALALPALGYAVCTVQFPGYAFGDVQESSEYAVHAIRRLHAATGRRIAVFGHSQGGIEPRWAIRWWPDVGAAVEDLIMLSAPNHGAAFADLSCNAPCLPALWQQSQGSQLLAALNDGDETPGEIAYTSIYSHTDWVIQPSLPEATAALEGAANIAVQDVCAGHVVDHIQAAFDAVVYALVVDALSHDGPADPARIDAMVCAEAAMPLVDPVTGWQRTAELYALAGERQAMADNKVDAEPALRDYAQQDFVPTPAGGGALPPLSIALLAVLALLRSADELRAARGRRA